MDSKKKKSLLKVPSFQDAAFVGLCSAGLLAYSLYHHHFDRNTSEWKTSPFLRKVRLLRMTASGPISALTCAITP